MLQRLILIVYCISISMLMSACHFHLQGQKQLVPQLHTMYLQTDDPYGLLAKNLRQSLKLSNVHLVDTPDQAITILSILKDENSQRLLSVSGTQQTRQYNLAVTVTFEVTDKHGHPLIEPQTLTETRVITEQSNQILGSSNEATLFYQQMRRSLAYAIMNRLASKEITRTLMGKTINSKKKSA